MPTYDIDASDYDPNAVGGTPEPGTYFAEVAIATMKTSSKGDPMLSLRLIHVETRKVLAFDNIMLGGGGKNMGLAKLYDGLGVPRLPSMRVETTDMDVLVNGLAMKGRRLAVRLKHEMDNKNQLRAVVDIRASSPFKCGMLNEDAARAAGLIGEAAPPAPGATVSPEDVPF